MTTALPKISIPIHAEFNNLPAALQQALEAASPGTAFAGQYLLVALSPDGNTTNAIDAIAPVIPQLVAAFASKNWLTEMGTALAVASEVQAELAAPAADTTFPA